MECAKCGKDLPAQEGSGRPRKFCDDACRRAATMELRRLDSLIAKLEHDHSAYRIKGASGWADNAAKEIKRLELRLVQIIAAGDEGAANACNEATSKELS